MKLHTGDSVVIISGKDKGKTGSIMRVLPAEHRVVISGINMRTRHIKKTYQEAGRILKYEASINVSKVMLVDPKTKKPSRIGYKVDEKGKKIRISKLSGEIVVKVRVAKVQPKAAKAEKAEKPAEEKAVKKTEAAAPAAKSKQPFWKRMQFGSAVQGDGSPEESRMKQDHTISPQNIPHKSAGRGS